MSLFLPPLTPTFEAALRDVCARRPEFRVSAARRLASPPEAREDEALFALIAMTSDANIAVRVAAIGSLGRLGNPAAISALAALAQDGEARVCEWAVIALAALGGEEAVSAIRSALHVGTDAARFQAVVALAEVAGADAVGDLAAVASDPDPEIRLQVAHAFALIADPLALGTLQSLLDDPIREVREAAAAAWAFCRGELDPRVQEALISALYGSGDTAQQAARACGKVNCVRAADRLATLATAVFTPLGLRSAAIESLLALRDPRGPLALERLRRSLRPSVRAFARAFSISAPWTDAAQ